MVSVVAYIQIETHGVSTHAVGEQAHGGHDYSKVYDKVRDMLHDPEWDDGSFGPLLVRLAWHASGSYDKWSGTGGSQGATMRFSPECGYQANKGLDKARDILEPIKRHFLWISYADLWTLAGCVAVEVMGGPVIPWRPGRVDALDGSSCPPDGRLPSADKGADHVREIFGRMGFDDRDMVALIGAHTVGRCHARNSGFVNPWTTEPTKFSNRYFVELTSNTWTEKKWDGPMQYEDPSGKLMMLPTDMALMDDSKFMALAEQYARDRALFFEDFAMAFSRLLELGVSFPDAATTAVV
ncbi:hypothetical protein FOA52_005131 [Chlamydomonas sp. UWO 241]|nr:hypothetical protein FOA52_005131 [Chlamydomonas sp. UWO 241]